MNRVRSRIRGNQIDGRDRRDHTVELAARWGRRIRGLIPFLALNSLRCRNLSGVGGRPDSSRTSQ
jgi:hypothetical protein